MAAAVENKEGNSQKCQKIPGHHVVAREKIQMKDNSSVIVSGTQCRCVLWHSEPSFLSRQLTQTKINLTCLWPSVFALRNLSSILMSVNRVTTGAGLPVKSLSMEDTVRKADYK